MEKYSFLRNNLNEETAAVFLFASSLALNFYLFNSSFSDGFNSKDPLKQLLTTFVIGPQGVKPIPCDATDGTRNSKNASSSGMQTKSRESNSWERDLESLDQRKEYEKRTYLINEIDMNKIQGKKRNSFSPSHSQDLQRLDQHLSKDMSRGNITGQERKERPFDMNSEETEGEENKKVIHSLNDRENRELFSGEKMHYKQLNEKDQERNIKRKQECPQFLGSSCYSVENKTATCRHGLYIPPSYVSISKGGLEPHDQYSNRSIKQQGEDNSEKSSGEEEEEMKRRPAMDDDMFNAKTSNNNNKKTMMEIVKNAQALLKALLSNLLNDSSPVSCHSYAVKGSLKVFIIGWAIQVPLNLLKEGNRISSPSLKSAETNTRRNNSLRNVVNFILNPSSLNFSFFLSSLVLVYRSSSCLLRRMTGKQDDALNEAISSFTGAFVSMYTFYPSTQISLYIFWKTVFTMYWMRFGHDKHAQLVMDAFFYFADSFLINCMVMEPHLVAPSYLRFIDSITGRYLTHFNVISHFLLTDRISIKRYGTQIPVLEIEHLSRKYLETAGSWALEQQ